MEVIESLSKSLNVDVKYQIYTTKLYTKYVIDFTNKGTFEYIYNNSIFNTFDFEDDALSYILLQISNLLYENYDFTHLVFISMKGDYSDELWFKNMIVRSQYYFNKLLYSFIFLWNSENNILKLRYSRNYIYNELKYLNIVISILRHAKVEFDDLNLINNTIGSNYKCAIFLNKYRNLMLKCLEYVYNIIMSGDEFYTFDSVYNFVNEFYVKHLEEL